jgi:hypothetical protein
LEIQGKPIRKMPIRAICGSLDHGVGQADIGGDVAH